MRHDAIFVTSWKEESLVAGRDAAQALGLVVTEIVESHINGYKSFMVAPDGSKEGWPESSSADHAREAWEEWADGAYRTGVYLDWVHVSYAGDDKAETRVVRQAEKREDG